MQIGVIIIYFIYYSLFINIITISGFICMRHARPVAVNGMGKMRTSINIDHLGRLGVDAEYTFTYGIPTAH